jgi:hypothetical protein
MIARRLRIPYLWIDSLCIIQDDPSDWETEAGLMCEVYSNSFLTFAALDAQDSTEALLVPRPRRSAILSFLQQGQPPKRLCISSHGQPYKMPEGKLNSRAWTYQEIELSARILFFKRDRILWECRTKRGTSEIPWAPCRTITATSRRVLSPRGKGETDWTREWVWKVVMSGYSFAMLTFESDRLTALAGLARKVAAIVRGSMRRDCRSRSCLIVCFG